VHPASGSRRAWRLTGCALMVTVALAGCGPAPTAAPPGPCRTVWISRAAAADAITDRQDRGYPHRIVQCESGMLGAGRQNEPRRAGWPAAHGGCQFHRVQPIRAGDYRPEPSGECHLARQFHGWDAAIRAVSSRVRGAAHTSEGVKVMLAADQEGGLVQRLRGPGFTPDPVGNAASQAVGCAATSQRLHLGTPAQGGRNYCKSGAGR
jgi:hypothetical protein